MSVYKTILYIAFFQAGFMAQAQPLERFNTFSFSVNEGLLQTSMNDMAFDSKNFCWLSFPNGIQKFDGTDFTIVPVQPGLPDDKLAFFFTCSHGELFISHSQGISKYEITGNRFNWFYYNKPGEKKPVMFIGEHRNIIYVYTETGNINGINCLSLQLVSETATGIPGYATNDSYRPRLAHNIIKNKAAFQVNAAFYLWDLEKEKLISKSDSMLMPARPLLLKTENELLYFSYHVNSSLQLFNFKTKSSSVINEKVGNVYYWQNRVLLNIDNKLYAADTALRLIKSELVNFQNQPITGNSTIARVKEDHFGNLYLATTNSGIKKIIRNNYPIKYFGTSKREDNFVISILPDKKQNRLLAGTARNGLLVFDTLQRLIRHIKTLPGKTVAFSANTIIKDNKGNYLLYIWGENNVWSLSHDLTQLKSIPLISAFPENKKGIGYYGNFLYRDERGAISQSEGRLYKTSFTDNMVTEYPITNSYTMSGLFYNSVIMMHGNDELIFVDAQTFETKKRVPFKNTGYVRCFTSDDAGNIFVGCNKGIFKIDSSGNILQHFTKENGLPDECIYAMVFDNGGLLWCSTNKGIFRLNPDNSILQLTKEDGLQENEFNTNTVAKTDDGEIFFGGVNGISSFYPAAISSYAEKINLFFTKIKINNEEAFKDTAVWKIKKIDLPYDQNSLAFDFIAMANNNPGQYIYQYKMEGIDRTWIQNSGLQTVRYFLPPGEYVFKIYASRFFDKDAKSMKEIRITINPPFWKTWWFITAVIALALAALAYAINRYNKKKYLEKLAVLEHEHRIQLERERISRDLHDSIGAYANAVLYNTELLQKETGTSEKNALMNDLKFASKDIITSLRETVWALKKDNYSAEECWLRIKNFMQALARYYPGIHFKVEGEAAVEKHLHHTKALNVVRIVQEAVTNAIKHAATGSITVSSNQHTGKWQLTVEDDGSGFDYEAIILTESGNGLLNMQQRAIDSGLDLTVTSIPGKGTGISILV
ncbi:MAG: ATP-binding protein [Ferruginibacter sp.]